MGTVHEPLGEIEYRNLSKGNHMNDEYIPDDSEVPALNQRAGMQYYMARIRKNSRLINEARDVIIDILKAVGKEELQDAIAKVSRKLAAELNDESPNISMCRMWVTVSNVYSLAIGKQGDSDSNMWKDALVAMLERDLSRQIDQKSLFVHSIVDEIDRCEIYE